MKILEWTVLTEDMDFPGPIFSSEQAAKVHAETLDGLVVGLVDVVITDE